MHAKFNSQNIVFFTTKPIHMLSRRKNSARQREHVKIGGF